VNVTWTIVNNGARSQAHVHEAPIVRGDVARGGFWLSCSRKAPSNPDADVRETDSPVTCETCLKDMERRERRSR
jgi:hypothetical protein